MKWNIKGSSFCGEVKLLWIIHHTISQRDEIGPGDKQISIHARPNGSFYLPFVMPEGKKVRSSVVGRGLIDSHKRHEVLINQGELNKWLDDLRRKNLHYFGLCRWIEPYLFKGVGDYCHFKLHQGISDHFAGVINHRTFQHWQFSTSFFAKKSSC